MYSVEMYVQVRRAGLVEDMSVREASRVFGLHRDTVRKMLDSRCRQAAGGKAHHGDPTLRQAQDEPYTGVIDAILEADNRVPRKQRDTARRIFERRGTSTVLTVSTS